MTGGKSLPIICTLCSKAYHLDECTEFLKKPLGERRDFIKEKGLCFGCYSSEHIAKLYRSRRSSKTCNKKHPTSLHDYNWKPEEVKTERRNSQNKESETSKKNGEDQITNVCTTICNVTEAGDVRITMGSFQYGCTTRTIQTTRYVFMLCLIMPVVELSLKNIRRDSFVWKELKANFCYPLCMAPKKSILRLYMD